MNAAHSPPSLLDEYFLKKISTAYCTLLLNGFLQPATPDDRNIARHNGIETTETFCSLLSKMKTVRVNSLNYSKKL